MSTERMVEVTMTFQGASLMPKDDIVNTWHFHTSNVAGGISADWENVRDMVRDFYFTAPSGGGNPLINYSSKKVLSGKVTLRMYKLEDPKPRAPFHVEEFTASTMPSSDSLPTELTLCMSYQATKESGKPQARRRGRIYLPPVATINNTDSGRPGSGYINAVKAKASELKAAADASLWWEWVVWSHVNQDHSLVDNGWVDNAWDIQRRRGVSPTARNAWT